MALIKQQRECTKEEKKPTETCMHSIKIFIFVETIEWKACVAPLCGYSLSLTQCVQFVPQWII